MVYEIGNPAVDDVVWRVLDGDELDRTDGIALIAQPVKPLAAGADHVRSVRPDGTVDVCSIANVRAGDCAEDCGFCAQSVHLDTGTETYGFLRAGAVLDAVQHAERDGAQRFGIVVAEKGVSKERRPDEWTDMLEAIRLVRDETSVEIDASLGLLTEEEARVLADEGVNHYSHNIEASPRYFGEVVGTHDFGDRLVTLRWAKDAGMDLCAGIILGMGETPAGRVDVALELQKIGVKSLPVNVLNPVPGTPFGNADHADIATTELVKTVTVYRLLHPDARVRLTGGREVSLAPGEQYLPFEVGADGVLTGDYLTTDGQSPAVDIEVVERTGLEPNRAVNDFDVDAVKRREARDG